MRPMFGAMGRTAGHTSLAFVSQAAAAADVGQGYGLHKRVEPVRRCRGLSKADMRLNDACPKITVDPETYLVTADGLPLTGQPAREVPLARKYSLF